MMIVTCVVMGVMKMKTKTTVSWLSVSFFKVLSNHPPPLYLDDEDVVDQPEQSYRGHVASRTKVSTLKNKMKLLDI